MKRNNRRIKKLRVIAKILLFVSSLILVGLLYFIFYMIDCQVKCNKINEKIYKALRGEYENQGVYGDDY